MASSGGSATATPAGRRILETLGKEPAWSHKRAETELRRRLVDVERDHYTAPDKTTFAAFADRWLTDYLPGRGLKLTTTDSYQQTLHRHLLPAFGHHTLTHLEQHPELIDHYITSKIQSGLAPKTVTNQLLVLQVMLKRAVRWRLIRHNPVTDCDRPRLQQADMNILTEPEIAHLWTAYTSKSKPRDDGEQRSGGGSPAPSPSLALGTAHAPRRTTRPPLARHPTPRRTTSPSAQALVNGRFTTPKSAKPADA